MTANYSYKPACFYVSSPAGLEPVRQRYVASRADNLATDSAICTQVESLQVIK